MSGPFIDIPDDSLGYWSPATASVDWCEANYAYVQRGECMKYVYVLVRQWHLHWALREVRHLRRVAVALSSS